MGKLRPIGSEKLEGMDKIYRMLEISNYKLNIPKPINEDTSVEYKKTLVDGNTYHIVKEKNGYVLKKGLTESVSEYIEPIKNRKFYPSYSQALKRLNLITKEVNQNEGYGKSISLFESDEENPEKYILKIGGEQKEQAPPAPAPVPAPLPAPQPTGAEMPPPPDMGGEEIPEPEMDMPEPEEGEEEPEDDEEQVTFKTIQKLTGKLGQKIRAFLSDEENEMSSKDIKYVINSVLSALNLDSLEDEDKEEIMGKFEGGGEEMPEPDMGGEEIPEPDMGGEEISEPEPEVGESYHRGSMRERQQAKRMDNMFGDMFTESKVDKVLSKYFQPQPKKSNPTIGKIQTLSENYTQEKIATKLIKNYPNAKLLGKNKNNNLVFEINEERISITPKGGIL
jgi:hypothetical protein